MKQNILYNGRVYIGCELLPDNFYHYLPEYLCTLTSYPYTGTNLKDGQVVVEGVDYELRKEVDTTCFDTPWWEYATDELYELFNDRPNKQRIVAIPSEHPSKDKKEESQEELWHEAYKIYSRREHSDDSVSDLMKQFSIQRKQ